MSVSSTALRQRVFYKLHRERINKERRERYRQEKLAGNCPKCFSDPKPEGILCQHCLDKAKQSRDNMKRR